MLFTGQRVLIDATNIEAYSAKIIDEIRAASFIGIDVETQDSNRHEGLNTFCKYDEDGFKGGNCKLVFDMRRTIMTGLSLYPEGSDTAYYVNLNHADVENRVPWALVKAILDELPEGSYWVAHNAAYELTAFRMCYDYDLVRYICTLQMAVSAFGPDEYDLQSFFSAGQGGMKAMIPELMRQAIKWDPDNKQMPSALEETIGKIIGKQTASSFSYNGFVNDIAYSYGLKKLVKKFFGYQMKTFEETLNGKAHMGQLTGPETADYGADDAIYALKLFRHLMDYMAQNCPETIQTFFDQENPCVRVFSDIWAEGMRINTEAVFMRRDSERAEMANILRNLKKAVKKMLPFDNQPHKELLSEKWYDKNHAKYRLQIETWANSEDHVEDFLQCHQVRGPVSNAWAVEQGLSASNGINLAHYMPVRTLLYDLLQTHVIRNEGKIQSDGEARGKLKDRFERLKNNEAMEVIDLLNKISGVEQRMKLYLNPYVQLMDPETGCMYPTVSSMLASRRMAASNPNPMQLAKRGESTYVRGFFVGDHPDHVIVSIDWSSVELVEIGEFSGDPEFVKAYSTIPHADLHAGSAADILAVDVPGLTEEAFKDLKKFKTLDEWKETHEVENEARLFTNLKGENLDYDKSYKYWRTEVGKGANFNYWYSGWLATIGERMGWDTNKTAEATDRYRARFPVAEKWRTDLIREGQENGFITLRDGHRRVRFEATPLWNRYFLDKFLIENRTNDEMIRRYNAVWQYIARKIQGRANNQLVNSDIQGTCATIAKRSILRINKKIADAGWTKREARFMIPVHDELVYSVHKDIVPEFINMARGTMIDHPDLFKKCKLDASPSVGLTFEPWHEKKAPTGQFEVYEAADLPFIARERVGGRLNDDEIRGVVDYLYEQASKA